MAGAVEFTGDCIPLIANADLSAKQFTFVVLVAAATGKVDSPAGDTENILGILQNKPKAGEVADVKVAGGSKLVVGAAITNAGVDLMATASTGKGLTATTGKIARAINLEPAAADGDIISVWLCGPWAAL